MWGRPGFKPGLDVYQPCGPRQVTSSKVPSLILAPPPPLTRCIYGHPPLLELPTHLLLRWDSLPVRDAQLSAWGRGTPWAFVGWTDKLLCCCLVIKSCPTLCELMDCSPPRLVCPWDFPSKNTGVGFHVFLQEIFPTQGSNLGRWNLYH